MAMAGTSTTTKEITTSIPPTLLGLKIKKTLCLVLFLLLFSLLLSSAVLIAITKGYAVVETRKLNGWGGL